MTVPNNSTVVNGVFFFVFASGTIIDGKAHTLKPERYTRGSNQAQVFILLHELAHSIDAKGFQADFGVPSAGRRMTH